NEKIVSRKTTRFDGHENDSLILSLRYIGISGDYMVSRDNSERGKSDQQRRKRWNTYMKRTGSLR
ncbi:MAG: hypothetical protein LBS24_02875, partial [Clostridiales Family XIII bacterium]|nr:hypothetical protein [Clostridiales Family XIII bacterium]